MQYSFNDDIKEYPLLYFDLQTRELIPIPAGMVNSVKDYNHYDCQLHHFIEKQIRKNNLEFYNKIKYLQKLIIVPSLMNIEASSGISDDKFYKNWGIEKYKIIFQKSAWLAGLYPKTNAIELMQSHIPMPIQNSLY